MCIGWIFWSSKVKTKPYLWSIILVPTIVLVSSQIWRHETLMTIKMHTYDQKVEPNLRKMFCIFNFNYKI